MRLGSTSTGKQEQLQSSRSVHSVQTPGGVLQSSRSMPALPGHTCETPSSGPLLKGVPPQLLGDQFELRLAAVQAQLRAELASTGAELRAALAVSEERCNRRIMGERDERQRAVNELLRRRAS